MSGATPTTQEPESFAPRPPDDFDDHFTDHEFPTPHHPSSRSDRGLLRHGMNAISMERIEGIPPPPSSFTGPAATGYNYQSQNAANKFAKRKQSVTASLVEDPALCAIVLTLISVIIIIVSLPFSLFFCIKVVQEYERAVIFRLGRLVTGGARGPGIFFIIPCIDTYSKADLRTVSFDVPPQEILSRDSVTVAVDAVVYFRISNAIASVSNVEDYARSTRLLAATTLRNVLGTKNLSEILSERESISHMIQSALDDATDTWGVKVERVEIKDVRLPVQLQRAMAAEAEATREARAKVIAAEGEQRASRALKEAAEVIACSPAALQLRYLQTLNSIASERNSTIVFPVPMELFRGYAQPAHSTPPSLPPPSVANVHIDQQTTNALAGKFENLSTTPMPPMAATPMQQLEGISSSNLNGNGNNNNNNINSSSSSSNKLQQQQSIVTSSASLLDKVSTNLPTSTGCTHTSGSHPYPAPLPPTLVSRSITSTTSSSIRSLPPEKPSRTTNSNLSDGPIVD